jgi:hypothetical protein
MTDSTSHLLGELAANHEFSLEEQQKNSWVTQVALIKDWLKDTPGHL